jgi:cytochrome bd-type quinol oxidase subunit 2
MAQTEIECIAATLCESLPSYFCTGLCCFLRHSLHLCGQNPARHSFTVGVTRDHSCLPCWFICYCGTGTLTALPEKSRPVLPFLLGLLLFVVGISGIAFIVFPEIVPFSVSLWDAASSSTSQPLVMIGAACVTPVVLAYSAFAYWIFRGKTPENRWEA